MAENNSLLLQEIDEEVRAERLRAWWQRFGSWVVGLCVIAVLATVGYQYDRNRRVEADQKVTSALIASNDALDRGQQEVAAKQLLEHPEHAEAVTLLARLKAAHAYESADEHAEAQQQYEIVAKSGQTVLANYAKLQLGDYQLKEGTPFAPLAEELKAISLYREGKKEEAQKVLMGIQSNPEAPISARSRAAELAAAFQ